MPRDGESGSTFAAAQESRLKFRKGQNDYSWTPIGTIRNCVLVNHDSGCTDVDAETWPLSASHAPYYPFPYVPNFRLINNVLRLRLKPDCF